MILNLQLFAYTGNSIVDYLKSVGQDSSFAARKQLASSNGISNYTGTASQNTQLLNALRSGSGGNTAKSNTSQNTSYVNNNTNSNVKVNGVDQSLSNTMNSNFSQSNNVTNKYQEADSNYDYYKELASKTDIIDQKTWDALNKPFETSDAYNQAMQYTNSLLEKLNSGKTSYTDQIKELMGQIINREDFEYDVDKDTLFQQALASAMGSGKTAMQDTIGQASALTGGYASSYAISAGNQAYNAYIQDAYSNLPEYYEMAWQAYQAEGQEMYQQLDMLNNADTQEWSRTYDTWQSNFANAQQIYNQDYSLWQDSINNAYNSANLQLSKHGQLVNDAYNLYVTSKDSADTLYAQEYQNWADQVAQATQLAGMQNTDYWNQVNYDQTQEWNQKNLDYNYAQLGEEKRQFNYSIGDTNNDGKVDDSEQAVIKASNKKSGYVTGSDGNQYKEATEAQKKKALEAYNKDGEAGLNKYVDSLPSDIDIEGIDSYVNSYGVLPISQRTYTVIDAGGVNWFGGVDNNAKVKDQYGNIFKLSELKKKDNALALALSKLKKGKTYTKK